MKTLDKGPDKVRQICNVLRNEALEPAKIESQAIIDAANAEAERIIKEAEKTA